MSHSDSLKNFHLGLSQLPSLTSLTSVNVTNATNATSAYAASTNATSTNATSSNATSTTNSTSVEIDKFQAFEAFKQSYPQARWMDEHKQLLRQKIALAKSLGEQAGDLRNHISTSLLFSMRY